MKKTAASIIILVSIMLMHYAIMSCAEDKQNVIYSQDFFESYKGKAIDDLINLFGKEDYTRKSQRGMVYIWDFNDLDKMPIKIKYLNVPRLKYRGMETESLYYADIISVTVWGKEKKITTIDYSTKKGWRTEEGQARVVKKEMKQEEKDEKKRKRQEAEDNPTSPTDFKNTIMGKSKEHIVSLLGPPMQVSSWGNDPTGNYYYKVSEPGFTKGSRIYYIKINEYPIVIKDSVTKKVVSKLDIYFNNKGLVQTVNMEF